MRSRTQAVLQDIAANVRRIRLDVGLTQEALAEASGYDVRMIQFIEAGARNLTIDSLVAVADALGTPAEALLAPPTEPKSRGRARSSRR